MQYTIALPWKLRQVRDTKGRFSRTQLRAAAEPASYAGLAWLLSGLGSGPTSDRVERFHTYMAVFVSFEQTDPVTIFQSGAYSPAMQGVMEIRCTAFQRAVTLESDQWGYATLSVNHGSAALVEPVLRGQLDLLTSVGFQIVYVGGNS